MKIVAIIPARGGSKRIKNKNLKDLIGKPLLAWTIQSALNSQLVDEVYVTSDDSNILDIATKYGSKTIKRPKKLANDIIMPDAAVKHAYEKIGKKFDYIVFLQVTSPFRTEKDIDNAINQILDSGADSLLSVIKTHSFIWKKAPYSYEPVNYEYLNRPRSQDFNQYKENGSIYIMKPSILINNENRLGGKIDIYEMAAWQEIDIDTAEDFEHAESVYKKRMNINNICFPLKRPDLIVYDFDGVMTNNKALINENGQESVEVNRSDGLAISLLKEDGMKQIILSTETNSVVRKRAEKLNIECISGVGDKHNALKQYISRNNISPHNVIYIGNDINDLKAMKLIGCPVSPSDAHESIKRISKYTFNAAGGEGVIRELYDILVKDV